MHAPLLFTEKFNLHGRHFVIEGWHKKRTSNATRPCIACNEARGAVLVELLSDSELMLSNDRLCRCRQSKLREEREKQEIFINLFDVGEGKKQSIYFHHYHHRFIQIATDHITHIVLSLDTSFVICEPRPLHGSEQCVSKVFAE